MYRNSCTNSRAIVVPFCPGKTGRLVLSAEKPAKTGIIGKKQANFGLTKWA